MWKAFLEVEADGTGQRLVAFDVLGLTDVVAYTEPDNDASRTCSIG